MSDSDPTSLQRVPSHASLTPEDLGLGSLFHQIRDAVAVTEASTERIVLWNPAAETLFGYPAEEALGASVELIIPDRFKASHRAGAQRYRETGHGKAIDSPRPMEFPARRKDGKEVFVELLLSTLDGPGGPFIAAIMRDQTDRKEAEEALARLAAIVESSSDAIVGRTLEGIITSWNEAAERIYGYTCEEAVGRPVSMLLPPDRLDELDRIISRLKRGEQLEPLETKRVRKDGTLIDVSITVSLVKDGEGTIMGASAIARDITEEKRTKEEAVRRSVELKKAQEINRFKNDLINTVSHELRTPLSSITGYAEFLEDNVAGTLTDDQREFVDQIMEGSRRLAHLVDDLLDFARLEAGTFRLELQDADAVELCEEVICSLRPQIGAAGLKIEKDLPKEPVMLRLDTKRVGQVLLNLIGNAIKFMSPGGRIRVAARLQAEDVRFEIRDTGIGISAENLPRLFHKFYQVDASTTRSHGGAGLGLSISKSIVETHGGRIGVESEGLGKGSTFWLTLPLNQPSVHA